LLDLQEQNILSIGRNLDLHKLLKCDKDLSQRIKIKDSFYSIYANNIGDENIKYTVDAIDKNRIDKVHINILSKEHNDD